MKKIFTLLLGTILTLGAFSQAPKTVLYITDPVPFAVGANLNDQFMFDIIEDLGYIVTAEQISATSSTTGYDVIFTSEAPASGNAGWVTYADAPLPMVMGKVWAIKASALGWIATENGGTDYGNSPDSVFTAVEEDHELTRGLGAEIDICDNSGEGDNGAWVDASQLDGATVVYAIASNTDQGAVVTLDQGASLNGHTLASPVVILGIHQVVYDALNMDVVPRLVDNCLKFAMGEDIGDPDAINDNDIINTTVYPNPSTGIINLRFNQFVTSAQVTITALDGRTIRTSDIYQADNATLDLSDLTSGIYILHINGENISFAHSISIN